MKKYTLEVIMHTMIPGSYDVHYDQVKRYEVIATNFRTIDGSYRFYDDNEKILKGAFPVALTIIKNIQPYEQE